MPLTPEQRKKIIELLSSKLDRTVIAKQAGVTVGQVSAVAAHVKMGRYILSAADKTVPEPLGYELPSHGSEAAESSKISVGTHGNNVVPYGNPIFLGTRLDTGDDVFWNPFPPDGSPNPHTLVIGESGSGKTFAAQCIVAELATRSIPSIIFDYAQGFGQMAFPVEFTKMARPIELNAGRDGLAINPLAIFDFDVHGPINVAQRVADTFERVYPRIGVQQHALIREVIIEVFAAHGVYANAPASWNQSPPPFEALWDGLKSIAEEVGDPRRSIAAKTYAHISTTFVFRTFRGSGQTIEWETILARKAETLIIQLKGLEQSTQKVVTEFLLWNLIGFVESKGPTSFRVLVVLDEAHRLSFADDSPVERLLREGRKFGVGVLLASQQATDVSEVAFSNTATKLIFRLHDPPNKLRKLLGTNHTSSRGGTPLSLLPTLKVGSAILLANGSMQIVSISGFPKRRNQRTTS